MPADIDVVMIAHPKALMPKTQYALDQFVMRGGRALVLLDPVSEIARQEVDPSGGPSQAATLSSAASIETLMKSWGVHIDTAFVVGDGQRALAVNTGSGVKDYLPWLSLKRDDFNQNDPVIGDFETINLGSAGIITPVGGRTTKVTPLIQSTKYAMPIEAARVQFQPDPDELIRSFIPTGETYMIAARITGPVKSAFPAGPPADATAPPAPGAKPTAPLPANIKESKGVNIILVADSDIFQDNFWVQVQDIAGQRVAQPMAGNGDFILNAIDNLSGSSSLLSLRARGTFYRPFTLVNDMRRRAQSDYARQVEHLQAKVSQTEQRLQELQGQRTPHGGEPGQAKSQDLFSPEQRAEVEKFRLEYFRSRKELRDVQRSLSSGIDSLGGWLAAINILLVPLMLAVLAIVLAVMRRQRPSKPVEGASS